MTKHTYKNAYNKKEVREYIFSYFKDKYLGSLVGLAGPDIRDYVNFCRSKKYRNIEVWENNPTVMVHQLSNMPKRPIRYKFGNILDADVNHWTLFDLDYCVSVRYMKEHIQKFKDNFIMTFSTRIGVQETIDKFFQFRREPIVNQYDVEGPGLRNIIFQTKLGNYLFITYHDTSAMCCFAKIK